MEFSKFQNSNITPKTPKSQKLKNIKKSCKEASNKKNLEKKLQLELKNIKNEFFENFKHSKLTPKD